MKRIKGDHFIWFIASGQFYFVVSLYLPWASDDDGNANEGTGKTKSTADNGEAKSSASSLYDNPNLLDKSSKTN